MTAVNGRIAVLPPRRPPGTRLADRITPLPAPHRPSLVGRDAEIAALTAALDRALTGTSQVAEITGDPGIGKTALLAEIAAIARQRGIPVAGASATPVQPGVFAAALADRLPGTDPALRRDHAKAFAGLGLGPSGDGIAFGDRRFAGERALVRALATPSGLVLVLDDLHHGDDQTLALLGDLLTRPIRTQLLVVYAFRDRQAPLALRAAAGQGRAATALPLAPLTEAQCAQLADEAAGTPGSRARQRALYHDSHGIPLYLRALATDPAAVHGTLLADLDPLSPGARRAVSAAAVLGGQIEPGIVAAVADLPETTRYTVFDELCRHDLVRPVAGTGRFDFRHPLLCEAVYQGTEPGWRLAAHTSAAEVLRARHAPAHALAPHLVRIADPGTAESVAAVVATLTEAAAAVRTQSPATAVHWLETAFALLPDHPANTDDRGELQLELALTLGAAGRGAAARERIHAAIPLLRPHMVASRLRAVTYCSQLERQLAHRDEGPALLRRELDSLATGQSAYGAALMAELAGNELIDGRLAEARTWAGQAVLVARRHGARQVEAAGHGVLTLAHCQAGDVAKSVAELAQATAILDGLLDCELAGQLDAGLWTGWAELMLGRPWDALRHLDRTLAVGKSAGPQLGVAYLMVARVVTLKVVGRLTEAVEGAEELADLADAGDGDAGTLRGIAAIAGAWVEVWAGTGSRRAPSRYRPEGIPADLAALGWFAIVGRGMWAEVLLARGDPGGSAALLTADGPRLPLADAWSRVLWCEILTRSALAAGRIDSARGWAERAAEAAAPLAVPALNGTALLARALVQAAADPAMAAVTADIAAAEFTRGGMLTDARRAMTTAAAARAACGEIERARRDLAAVQEAYEQGGALLAARDTAKLRTRVASRARTPAASRELTAREREVAALVAEGASNREIARRLDVKEKTVEMHVTRVFAKLGVVNRVGVAREFKP